MKMSLQIPLLVATSWLALCLAAGCNGVLGIEEARPRGTGGGTGNGSGGNSSSAGGANTPGPSLANPGADSCNGDPADNAACNTCVAKQCSTTAQNLCTKDHACRKQMDDYGACLGAHCVTADCFERTLLKTGQAVDDCYTQCADECAVSPIYSPCDLYCACMGANCGDQFSDTPVNGQFASLSDCLTTCAGLPPEVVACRRSHCELAGLSSPPNLTHCDHAVGNIFCATTTAPTIASDRAQCADKSKSVDSFACVHPSDCCSNNCNSLGICVHR